MDDQDEIPRWRRTETVAGMAVALVLLLITLAYVGHRWGIAEDRMEMMATQAAAGFLAPPSGTQRLRIDPRLSREVGLHNGDLPTRFDLVIALRSNNYRLFRIALSRDDGTAVLYVDRLARDTNGDLQLGFNSTLLPNGRYRLEIEGVNWRGQRAPVESLRLVVSGR